MWSSVGLNCCQSSSIFCRLFSLFIWLQSISCFYKKILSYFLAISGQFPVPNQSSTLLRTRKWYKLKWLPSILRLETEMCSVSFQQFQISQFFLLFFNSLFLWLNFFKLRIIEFFQLIFLHHSRKLKSVKRCKLEKFLGDHSYIT